MKRSGIKTKEIIGVSLIQMVPVVGLEPTRLFKAPGF